MHVKISGHQPLSVKSDHPERSAGLLMGLFLFYALLLSYGLAFFSRQFLPEKNFNDEGTILDFIAGREASLGPSPYSTTAWLFTFMGLTDAPRVVGFLAVTFFSVSVFLALRRSSALSWPLVLVACGSFVLAGVYLGKYSKEFFVLPVIIIFFLSGRSWKGEAVWVASLIAYAYFVREYWFLILAIYLAARLVLPRIRTVRLFLASWGLLIVGMVLVFNVILGVSAVYYRRITNEGLLTDRATMIVDPITSSFTPLQVLNLAIILLSLMLPIPLLLTGSPIHIMSAIGIGTVWVLVFVRYFRALSGLRPDTALSRHYVRGLSLLVAYLSTQALFEPDYGSYLRHLIPLLPVVIYCVGVKTSRGGEHDTLLSASRN